jgi:hypothetical protein
MMPALRPSRFSTSILTGAIGLAWLLTGTTAAHAPRTQPPLPNRANELLPSWLHIRDEFRDRLEGLASSGFVENRDDLYWLTRLSLTATYYLG